MGSESLILNDQYKGWSVVGVLREIIPHIHVLHPLGVVSKLTG